MEQIVEYLTTSVDSLKTSLSQWIDTLSNAQILMILGAMALLIVVLLVLASVLGRKRGDALDLLDQQQLALEAARREADERIKEHEQKAGELIEKTTREAEAKVKLVELDVLEKADRLDKLHAQKSGLIEDAKKEAQQLILEAQRHANELLGRAEQLLAQIQNLPEPGAAPDTAPTQPDAPETQIPTQS